MVQSIKKPTYKAGDAGSIPGSGTSFIILAWDPMDREAWWATNHGASVRHDSVTKPPPMEKICKKAKWLSGEALQIAVKRREAKGKGEKERYTHLNAQF